MLESPKLAELKKELNFLSAPELKEICLRLAKYKTENKELLQYLLFFSDNKEEYVDHVKAIIVNEFDDLHPSIYSATKQIRKLLRTCNKHIKFLATKHLEVEIVIAFCKEFIKHPIVNANQRATFMVLVSQLKRLIRLIPKLENDLKFDYQTQFDDLLVLLKHTKPYYHESELR